MIKLTKDMFSCWGNKDKYDDELIIEHDPKIESKTIADQILDDYEKARIYEQIEKDIPEMYKDWKAILPQLKQNQKLRELVEKYYKHVDLTISSICKQMLEECEE